MNYFSFGGLIFLRYAYVDLNIDSGYIADSLFYKRKIHVLIRDEMARDGDKYRFIFCKIWRKDKQRFEEALAEIQNKMYLFGHNDYNDYCDHMIKHINEGIGRNHHERK